MAVYCLYSCIRAQNWGICFTKPLFCCFQIVDHTSHHFRKRDGGIFRCRGLKCSWLSTCSVLRCCLPETSL